MVTLCQVTASHISMQGHTRKFYPGETRKLQPLLEVTKDCLFVCSSFSFKYSFCCMCRCLVIISDETLKSFGLPKPCCEACDAFESKSLLVALERNVKRLTFQLPVHIHAQSVSISTVKCSRSFKQ